MVERGYKHSKGLQIVALITSEQSNESIDRITDHRIMSFCFKLSASDNVVCDICLRIERFASIFVRLGVFRYLKFDNFFCFFELM